MVNFNFRGLMAPTFTPFNDDLSLNLDVLPKYGKYLASSGIKGVLINGTSGEGMSMTVLERKLVLEEWIKVVRVTKQHLMVQVGGCPLPDALELARHAEKVGADSILCLPDLYFKPITPADLIRYLKVISDAAPNTPLLYYHIPMFSNVNIHMGKFLREAVGKIPTFHGIKFTSTLLDEGLEAVKANDGKYAVFLGADSIMAGAYTLGFDSAIATSLNMYPQKGVNILKAVNQSNLEEARKEQDELNAIVSVVTRNGTWVPTMKQAMNYVNDVYVGFARPPLLNLDTTQIKEMHTQLKSLGA